MDSLVYGSNAQGEMPGNGGERGDMKGGAGNRQPDADMEKPQGSAPPDAPSGSTLEKTHHDEAKNHTHVFFRLFII